MKTSKEHIEERRQRAAEYERMRAALLKIADAETTADNDRIEAIKTIYKLDAEGMPEP